MKRFELPYKKYKILCYKVFARDKWRCRCCSKRRPLHAHHIIYRSRGGGDFSWNLISLCDACHRSVHTEQHVLLLALDMNPDTPVNADQKIRLKFLDPDWTPGTLPKVRRNK